MSLRKDTVPIGVFKGIALIVMVEGSVEKLIPAILTARVCAVTAQVRMIVGLGLKKTRN